MTTDNELLQRAQTPPPPPFEPPSPRPVAPPADPVRPAVFWPAVIITGIACDLAVRVGHGTVAGSAAIVGLIIVVASQQLSRLRALDHAGLVLALGLALSLSLRTSEWVTIPALMAAIGITFSIGTGQLGTAHRPWISGLLHSIEGLMMSTRWATSLVERVSRGAHHSFPAIVRSVIIAGVLGLTMIALLASGDAVTASLLSGARFGSAFGHGVGIAAGVVAALATGFISYLTPPPPDSNHHSLPRFELEAKAAIGTVVAVLGAWSAIQISVALGAADHILSTEGLTVADYAREGFFQLVAVTAIVLVAVRFAGRISGLPSRPEGRSFRIAAMIIGGELLILIGSSFLRLGYYVDEFGLTMLRLSVACFLAWLSIFSVVVIARATGSNWAERWSHSIFMLSLGATVLAFSVANPEAIVVNTNLNMNTVDTDYLITELSGDGRQAIRNSDRSLARELELQLCDEATERPYGIASWNYGNVGC